MSQKKSFSDMLKESDTPVLVDFYADWCGPCQAMAPALKEYANEMKGKLKVIKVNIDENRSASEHYKIRGVPTLILFNKGKIAWQQSGAMNLGQLHQIVSPRLN